MKATVKRWLGRVPGFYRPNILSPRAVKWAYRLLLDRDPENRKVVSEKLHGPIRNVPDLRRDLILSAEFAGNNPDIAPFPLGTIVIAELSCGKRLYVDLGDGGVGGPIVRGTFESELLNILSALIEPGITALDIGANIGFFTIHLAHLLGPTGRVVAYEPIREAAALLNMSIRENHLENVVTLEETAVGDRKGHADILFVHNARNQGASYLVDDGPSMCATSHEVRRIPMRTLDACAFPGRVGFIKMDVEGAEPLCLRGADQLLQRDRPIIMTEVHPVQLNRVCRATAATFLNQFLQAGYRCYAPGRGGFTRLQAGDPVDDTLTLIAVPDEDERAQALLRK